MRLRVLATSFPLIVQSAVATAAISFAPGHYYTSNGAFSRDITEYDSTGSVLGSITIPATAANEIHGLAFGHDGLLYATALRDSGLAVLALDSSGAVEQTYP